MTASDLVTGVPYNSRKAELSGDFNLKGLCW